MYKVNYQEIKSFSLAVTRAKELNATVIELETGLIRWRPAFKTSAKKVQR